MGTLLGHAVPGTLFILFAIWWSVNIWKRYLISRRENLEYKNSLTFPCGCCCQGLKTFQVEGILKVVASTVGIIGELVTGFKDGQMELGNWHHVTMYAGMLVSGLVDILLHHQKLLPEGTDYITFGLAVLVEGVLFYFHIHDRDDLDIQLHSILICIIGFGVVTLAVEYTTPQSHLGGFARSYAFLLQGIWFWVVGLILYAPTIAPWATIVDNNETELIMKTALILGWMMIGSLIIIFIIGAIINCQLRLTIDKYTVM
ncbi:unnamed protein product [Owenia fusiformis]|uniref:Uncharacterized protein n=1 Tax=Owenia fusiformis TaxID=6347 RepID=A0A8J1TAJ8_OWEFU|nr:unnamed protein product [Owenia fusiformis]